MHPQGVETNNCTDWLTKLRPLENNYPYKQASPREDNFGIAIFSKYPIDEIREVYWGPSNIPSLKASLIVSGHRISLITTHPLPPVNDDYYHSRNSQLNEVALVSKNVGNPLILIGDLNVTMWSSDYMALETGTNLVNARKGFGILPTWPTILPMFMIPIDHCLVSSDFQVLEIKVGKNVGSDHLPLIVDLGLKS
ncbi:MAG: endonuclease/exonuclease/phosphatase family protein [Pleurocapsa sp. MO_192.B19]|nr:endonuclease/exonuclease/phosphatase family protein [Pleurocapsa sp. MO_192.B19]